MKHGLSQKELALGADISIRSLELIETAQMELDGDTLMRILGFLGYELEALSKEERRERNRRQLAAANNPEETSKAAARALFDLQW